MKVPALKPDHTVQVRELFEFALRRGDLDCERLIGAVIVGVGLPQLCVERDLIR